MIHWTILRSDVITTLAPFPYTYRMWVPSTYRQHTAYVHYCDVIMGAITSQITSLTIVYSTVYSDADQRKHQSSASLAFVRGIHRRPVNSPHKWPVTRKMFPFDDVIMHVGCFTFLCFVLHYLFCGYRPYPYIRLFHWNWAIVIECQADLRFASSQ